MRRARGTKRGFPSESKTLSLFRAETSRRVNFRSSVYKLLLRVRYFGNWPSIVLNCFVLNLPCVKTSLRHTKGRSRMFEVSRHNIFPLALLQDAGWVFDVGQKECCARSPKNLFFQVRLSTGYDIGHLAEVFLYGVYGSAFDFAGKSVVDVGGSSGESSIYFAAMGARMVFVLEPDPASYSLCVENIRLNGFEGKIIPLNCALTDSDAKVELSSSRSTPNMNTVTRHRTTVPPGVFDGTTNVQGISLGRLIAISGLDEFGLLKLDCEGCEYQVVSQLTPDLAARIKTIRMEYHKGAEDLLSKLESLGYVVETHPRVGGIGYLSAHK